ncbi:MAG: fimbria/pilus outer membrane usher protein [Polaromonas sp.]|nr:fimbria/pilus outer membrane usher protein [Polaromonas sp.]
MINRRRSADALLHALVVWPLFGLCATASAQPAPAVTAGTFSQSDQANRLIPLDVTVNNSKAGSWTLLERSGMLYASDDALTEWRIKRRLDSPGMSYRGQSWYLLAALPGFEAKSDFAEQSVALTFAPAAFGTTRLVSDASLQPVLSPIEPAFFANYDLNYANSRLRGSALQRELGALVELGASSKLGVLTSSHVAHSLRGNSPGNANLPSGWRRLETTFSRDLPDSKLTLRLGDTATRSALWSRSVYFGGIQLTRNFGLAPGFITQPLPIIGGTSSAPSTVELYINDALRQTSSVPAGPFAIDNFPSVSGAGQARIVVRDLLGRETVLEQSFFSSSSLLDKGLADWSLEAGAVRRDLGIEDASYGQRFVAGLYRYGLTRDLTLETRAEWGQDTRSGGVGLSVALPFQSLGTVSLAAGGDNAGRRGGKGTLGLDRTTARHSFSGRVALASQNFREIGLDPGTLAYKRESSANYSYAFDDFRTQSLGVSMASLSRFDGDALRTVGANYSLRMGSRGTLMFSATRVSGAADATILGASFILPLESRVVLASSLNHRASQTDGYASASQGVTGETGLGWRTLAGSRAGQQYGEGGVYYQGTRGQVTGDISAASGQTSLRLGARGGMVLMDGRLFASRTVQDSFALVEVPGYANVGVGFQGSMLTRTDAAGQALLPRLLPYQNNSIRLDPNELPISAELDSIEIVTVPASRSGVKVTFPVRSGMGALIRIVFDDGQPAPAGAELAIEGDKKDFFVARRGEAFVTGLQPKNRLRLTYKGQSCILGIELPAGQLDDIARVGPVVCKGVTR